MVMAVDNKDQSSQPFPAKVLNMSYNLYEEVEGKVGYWPDTYLLPLHLTNVANFGIKF